MSLTPADSTSKMRRIRIVSRLALALVWLYEGIIPKLLLPRTEQTQLIRQSGLNFGAPELTLQIMGVAQASSAFGC
ncbi:MAG: hypothetical protein H0W04_07145 [Chthoniobacterales bacterium]|nr:hypothetical protein [Chthoniobacterales bacterium]